MSYKVETIPNFDKELKRLAKKYPSLKVDLGALGQLLEENPEQATAIGKSCYKIRLAIKSKGRGKSGGARPGRRRGYHLPGSRRRASCITINV